jgi:CRP-like cAMP-binding protein
MQDLLSQVALFDGIPAEGLARLQQLGRIQHFTFAERLAVQGETAENAYVITAGRVRVERSHPELMEPVLVGELGPGAIVAHEGLLDSARHSVTVTAIEDTEAIELSGLVLSVTILKFPKVAGSLLRALSRHLRTTDELTEAVLAQHAWRRAGVRESVQR